jgi:hypothetical protein
MVRWRRERKRSVDGMPLFKSFPLSP